MTRNILAAIVILTGLAGCAAAPDSESPARLPPCDDVHTAKEKDKDGGIGGTGRGPTDCR